MSIDDGSPQSYLRKASDFLSNSGCIVNELKSDYKEPRYARLELVNMFTSLVALYTRAFATQWMHLKCVSDAINPAGTPIDECQRLMAELYISHWIMDLYTTVRKCVNELVPDAYVEFYTTRVPLGSNVYDAFLAHLNLVIRPTHITGCYKEFLFIPHFADNIDMSNNNPFNIQRFTLNLPHLIAIINAIKGKRVSWKTATLTNEPMGRPVWLFDWHTDSRVCSWFPRKGNYTDEDVMFAFVIGVACTPTQADQDADGLQSIPTNMTADCIDVTKVPRVNPRRYFGSYEVDSYRILEQKFYVDPNTRAGSQPEVKPGHDYTKMEIIEVTFIQLTTFIYYCRVILNINDDVRLTTLLGLLEGPENHPIC